MNRSSTSATRADPLHASPFLSPTVSRLAPPFALFVLALLFVGLYDPLHRPLFQDPGIFALLSQLVAQGFVPHQAAFNEQASLAFLVGGAAIWLGNLVGLVPLIALRLASMGVVGGVAVTTYAVGKNFTGSAWVGLIAGVILLGFQGYIVRAAVALEPKSLMLMFGMASLYYLQERKWFWAGALACAAALTWQVAGIYLLIALALALMQGGILLQERGRAFLLTGLGAAAVAGTYLAYFVAHNAYLEMFQQTFVAPALMHTLANKTPGQLLSDLVVTFYRGFHWHIVFGVFGLLGLLLEFGTLAYGKKWQAIPLRVGDALLQNPRTSGLLLATLGFFAMTYADFQNFPDWIPLLPFISIFAALFLFKVARFVLARVPRLTAQAWWVWAAMALVVFLFSTYETVSASRAPLRNTWQEQQQIADQLNRVIPADAPVWMLGKSELLFFMKRQNLNKYIYLLGRVDAASDKFDPGGFAGMLKGALAQKPVLYVLGRVKRGKFSTRANFDLVRKSIKGYVHLERCRVMGSGAFYAPPELAKTWFAKEQGGCLTNPPPK